MLELKSTLDKSVNFVTPVGDLGFFESRYVRRSDDYFICYLSSHSGCNRGCQMCHLTATKQTSMVGANFASFIEQAMPVFNHYTSQNPAKYVHFNWMARGEALANDTILDKWREVSRKLSDIAESFNLAPKFNVSTIMPTTYKGNLDLTFRGINPTIYYSLYSLNPAFRAKWLPGAMPAETALEMLKEYQESTKKIVKLHWAFIKGENDDSMELADLADYVRHKVKLKVQYNIVRYNPFSVDFGEEPEERTIQQLARVLEANSGESVQVVPRVGFDVKASCGMFVQPNGD